MSLFRLALLVSACSLLACPSPETPPPASTTQTLAAEDHAALQALEEAYVEAWLADDTLSVLSTLDAQAVLMPGGQEPINGLNNIRQFWWPDDGSRTDITQYTITIDEIAGSGDLAYSRARGDLSFTYEQDGTTSALESTAISLTVYRRQADGSWRILRRMWAPLRS